VPYHICFEDVVGASVDKQIFDEASIWNYLNLVIEDISQTTEGDGLDCFDEQTICHDVDGHPKRAGEVRPFV
jgi:hypothetical protein